MTSTASDAPPSDPAPLLPRRAFRAALGFLLIAALLGVLLRWQLVAPFPGIIYDHWLHAHSHTAFLGFVFNAFFALSLGVFVPADERPAYARIFLILQLAVVGMLATFPLQGYAAGSITFSTLHMAAAGAFAWRLWRRNHAAPAARGHLGAALFFLVISGLGPLTLGPLAAAGLRDSPAYALSIYFYLHAQYNGWFPFFLQAFALQHASSRSADPAIARHAACALRWLFAGALLTFAQSTLWLDPSPWVRLVALAGGLAQLIGFAQLLRALRLAPPLPSGPIRPLVRLAFAAFALKLVLQTASAWPGLAGLVNHRYVVIAFLHLVFLGVVAPAVFAAAAISEGVLVAVALGWTPSVSTQGLLLGAAIAMALAVVPLVAGTLGAGLRRR